MRKTGDEMMKKSGYYGMAFLVFRSGSFRNNLQSSDLSLSALHYTVQALRQTIHGTLPGSPDCSILRSSGSVADQYSLHEIFCYCG